MGSSTDIRCSAWTRGVDEMGLWKYWLSTLTPERLEQQRQYDRERHKKYHEEHKEEMNQKAKEWYERNKERLTEKHVCDTCGGSYTTHHRSKHFTTKRHQDMQARKEKKQQRAINISA